MPGSLSLAYPEITYTCWLVADEQNESACTLPKCALVFRVLDKILLKTLVPVLSPPRVGTHTAARKCRVRRLDCNMIKLLVLKCPFFGLPQSRLGYIQTCVARVLRCNFGALFHGADCPL